MSDIDLHGTFDMKLPEGSIQVVHKPIHYWMGFFTGFVLCFLLLGAGALALVMWL